MHSSAALRIRTAVVLALALCAPLAAQDRLAKRIDQFQHEADPVRKARDLAQFGGDQVNLAKRQLKSDDDVAALRTLHQYRDEVRESFAGLQASGIDAEKKPNGFMQLQISLRENIRHISDLIFTIPVDKRPFFRTVRDDLIQQQNGLIDALFPRRPKQQPKEEQP